MIKRNFLLMVLSFLVTGSYAQSTIKGRIIDSFNRKPIEFVNVTIYKGEDKTLLDGRLTDSTGLFEFKNLKSGNYHLKVTSIGYNAREIKNISTDGSGPINLGDILTEEDSSSLKEVVVNGQQQTPLNRFLKQIRLTPQKVGRQ